MSNTIDNHPGLPTCPNCLELLESCEGRCGEPKPTLLSDLEALAAEWDGRNSDEPETYDEEVKIRVKNNCASTLRALIQKHAKHQNP